MYKIIGADGKEYGPVSAEQLRQWIAQGRADARTRAAAEGMAEWKPLGAFSEFASLFGSAAPPPPSAPAIVATAPVRSTNGFAIAGLIMSILSVVVLCCCYGLPFNVLGLVFSIIALAQIRGESHLYEGLGMAIAGIVLSALSLIAGLAWFLFAGTATSWTGMMQNL